jgi:hypothetical protein
MSFIALSVVALYRLLSAYRDAVPAQKQNRHIRDKIGRYYRYRMKEPHLAIRGRLSARIGVSENCQSFPARIR